MLQSLFQRAMSWREMPIGAPHGFDIVAGPICDDVDARAFGPLDRAKRAPHGVRGDPRAFLRFHEFFEGTPKVVAIPRLSAPFPGGEAVVIVFFQPALEEFSEVSGKWNGALLAVLQIKRIETGF